MCFKEKRQGSIYVFFRNLKLYAFRAVMLPSGFLSILKAIPLVQPKARFEPPENPFFLYVIKPYHWASLERVWNAPIINDLQSSLVVFSSRFF